MNIYHLISLWNEYWKSMQPIPRYIETTSATLRKIGVVSQFNYLQALSHKPHNRHVGLCWAWTCNHWMRVRKERAMHVIRQEVTSLLHDTGTKLARACMKNPHPHDIYTCVFMTTSLLIISSLSPPLPPYQTGCLLIMSKYMSVVCRRRIR